MKINEIIRNNILTSPGHSWVLQLSSTMAEPEHSAPPCFAFILSSLELVLKPPPHVLEQSPISHLSHSQSTIVWIQGVLQALAKNSRNNNFIQSNANRNHIYINTWTRLRVAFFNFSWLARASSSICFFDKFNSGVRPSPCSACLWACSNHPIFPNAMDCYDIIYQY